MHRFTAHAIDRLTETASPSVTRGGLESERSPVFIAGYAPFTRWACRASGALLTVSAHDVRRVPLADIGELVKLGDGRWARYQQLEISGTGLSILVAVELDERTQRLLDAAEFGTALELDEVRAEPRLDLADVGTPSEVVASLH